MTSDGRGDGSSCCGVKTALATEMGRGHLFFILRHAFGYNCHVMMSFITGRKAETYQTREPSCVPLLAQAPGQVMGTRELGGRHPR
jgi:hypothetical protein